jgi:excisionase family DNA binding protein
VVRTGDGVTSTAQAEQAYSIKTAAGLKGVSESTIKRAIASTEPPFLRAKKVGGRIRIKASALDEWFDSLPDV